MKKKNRGEKKERGVALMMTLGVLALLMIMAMSFAYTTKTEALAASVNADMVRSRLLAESGLDRAVSFLREEFRRNPYPGARFYTPASGDWYTRGGSYLASVNTQATTGIETALSSVLEVSSGNWLYFTPEAQLHPSVGWIPIMAKEDPADSNSPESCVGLLSYLVVDESGKLDPTPALSSSFTEASGAGESRIGDLVSEIQVADLRYLNTANFPSGEYSGFVNAIKDDLTPPCPLRWLSIDHIAKKMADSSVIDFTPETTGQPKLDILIRSLRPYAETDNESWKNTTAAPGAGEYHKCNLTAIDWDNADVGNVPTATVDFSDPYSSSVGIQHLNDIYADMPDAATRNQFEANIIDYFDTDDAPTNDYDGTTATYVGLEEVPYINEVLVRVRYERADRTITYDLGWGPITILIGYDKTVYVEARAELVNIYGSAFTIPSLKLNLDFQFEWVLGSLTTRNVQFVWNDVNVGGDTHHAVVWKQTSFTQFFAPTEPGNVQGFRVNRARIAAAGADSVTQANLYDFADIGQQSGSIALVRNEDYRMASAEVDDPRLNTSGTGGSDNWDWSAFSAAGATAGSAGAVNGRVSLPTSGATEDTETATDPVDVSTAFILNADPTCLWQLGAIHRARRWQTINLHSANPNQTVGSYGYGDWPLLNQVKLTSDLTTRGRVNVFSTVPEVWKAVVQNVPIGSDYGDPGGGGTPIIEADATSLGTSIAQQNRTRLTSGSTLAWGPGGIAQLAAVSNVSGMDTDATQEELVGKIAGLLTDRHNYFTVLVCARAVKDLGDESEFPPHILNSPDWPPANWVEYATGRWCAVLGEQKILAEVYRDVYTNAFKVTRFKYLEE